VKWKQRKTNSEQRKSTDTGGGIWEDEGGRKREGCWHFCL